MPLLELPLEDPLELSEVHLLEAQLELALVLEPEPVLAPTLVLILLLLSVDSEVLEELVGSADLVD
jgi:hypothetical protein